MRRIGRLTVCMPPEYPPLVTGDAQAPGFDVELVGEVARRMGVGLTIQSDAAMTRDFNPRSWRITRAQCQVLAGGVVSSEITRSFLDTTPPHLETGWALISTTPVADLDGKAVAFLPGLPASIASVSAGFCALPALRPSSSERARNWSRVWPRAGSMPASARP
ncbi:MAG: transporter substrate-binding domain-containing protein [Devosia sp.]|nr:transporter substrate-binding domain-containing protein [Devosia sp.]